MSTLLELSRATGLSVTTVSEILRDKPGYNAATRKRVRDAALRLKYQPSMAARQLRGGRSGLLGVLIGMDNPRVNFDRLAHVERAAFARGYRLVVGQIHEADERAAQYLEDFASRGLDGIVWLHQPFGGTKALPRSTFDGALASVALDRPLNARGACVRVDYAAGVADAVRHLRERGRRRIALALAGRGRQGDPMSARLAGYRAGLRRAFGASATPRVWAGAMVEQPAPEQIERALDLLVTRGKSDALIASNDVWAMALIKALRRKGLRVPEDVAVVGFDNLDWSEYVDPALTTIDQEHALFAERALDQLALLLSGKPVSARDRVFTIRPRLVARESA